MTTPERQEARNSPPANTRNRPQPPDFQFPRNSARASPSPSPSLRPNTRTANPYSILYSDEEEIVESEDELASNINVEQEPRASKKRTTEQRSPKKTVQNRLSIQMSTAEQKERWEYLIKQGIKAFQDALLLSADNSTRVATKELLAQAEAVVEGRLICNYAATQELVRDVKAIQIQLQQQHKNTTNQHQKNTENTVNNNKNNTKSWAQVAGLADSAFATNNSNSKNTQKTKKQHLQAALEQQKQKELTLLTNQDFQRNLNVLKQRDAINAALAAITNKAPVVARISYTTNNNVVITTTDTYNADFLLQNQDSWTPSLLFQYQKIQKSESWIQVVAHYVYAHNEFLLNPALLKTEIETFNNVTIQGNPRWLTPIAKLKKLSSFAPNKRYGSIVFAVKNQQECNALLARKSLAIAGEKAKLVAYKTPSIAKLCLSCYRQGHTKDSCKEIGCKFCSLEHYTKDHASCKDCSTTGSLCQHQSPICRNCKGEHIATSYRCSYRLLKNREAAETTTTASTNTNTSTTTSPSINNMANANANARNSNSNSNSNNTTTTPLVNTL